MYVQQVSDEFDEIVSIEPFYSESSRYDITVEETHNFYVNGILVHNCQNCFNEMFELSNSVENGLDWYIEEKLDGCLTGSTLISTDQGRFPIEDIVKNPKNYKVKSYDVNEEKIVFDTIVNVMKKPNDGKQWFRLTLEDGKEIEITGNHKVYLPELKCWRKVENLCEGDVFLIE